MARRREKGFVLITIALCALGLFGACGLAVDVGRMYVVKNELQVFSDAAALAATLRLNGEAGGIARARAEVEAVRAANKWHLNNNQIGSDQIRLEFGRSINGAPPDSWTSVPPDPPANYSFARVTTQVPVPVYFMSAVTGRTSSLVLAIGTAGQIASQTPTGLFPFTPIAHNPADPLTFGFTVGQQYTLKWAASPRMNNTCAGDRAQKWIDLAATRGAENRGYYGSQVSASEIWNQVANDAPVAYYRIGEFLPMTGGAKTTVLKALEARIASDADPSAPFFHVYKERGRWRRITTVPVTDPQDNNRIVGFGRFFLLPAREYQTAQGNDPWCAEYLGPAAPEGSDSHGASPSTGMFTKVRLWQ